MRNTVLTISYFAALGLIVASRDRFAGNDYLLMGVVAIALFAGLALWVLVAQRHRDSGDPEA